MKPKHKLSLRHLNPVTISNLSTLESAHILGGAVTVFDCASSPCDDPLPTQGDPSGAGDGFG